MLLSKLQKVTLSEQQSSKPLNYGFESMAATTAMATHCMSTTTISIRCILARIWISTDPPHDVSDWIQAQ